ncbi:hypothetical protein M8745_20320, partial [Lutimaribacter sp. EGI FJ00014]|nr:hypothetical protein [Lutimaribacter sp. EGI FJ00014]
MGQYHYIVNLDKCEYLDPHVFDDGLKLNDFSITERGVLTALAVLLARDNGLGMGDFPNDLAVAGRWAGDRITFVGDYAENVEGTDVWHGEEGRYVNISNVMFDAMFRS